MATAGNASAQDARVYTADELLGPCRAADSDARELGQAAQVECEIDGRKWVQDPFPYQGKCLRALREHREGLSDADRSRVDTALAGTGCEVLFEG